MGLLDKPLAGAMEKLDSRFNELKEILHQILEELKKANAAKGPT